MQEDSNIWVYYAIIEDPSYPIVDKLKPYLTDAFLTEIYLYKKIGDQNRLAVGKYLLRKLIIDLGYDESIIHEYKIDEMGKPFIPNFLEFNITHTKHVVACAIHKTQKIGLDAEHIREINPSDFTKQFSPVELNQILISLNPQQTFFHYWTQKEAVMKLDGRGMRIPLHSIHLKDGHATVDGLEEIFYTYPISLDQSCKATVCSFLPNEKIYLKEVEL